MTPRIAFLIPVLAPLPDIAMHVIETPGIGFLLTHGMGLFARVSDIPGIFTKFAVIVAEVKSCHTLRPTRIFPLRLGGKAVFIRTFHLIEPANKLLAVVP
jgi:hypothetical protein